MADLDPAIREACRQENVHPELVGFLATALSRAASASPGGRRHVTPAALCRSLAALALEHFGGLALYVLESWGIRTTRDVGEIIDRLQRHKIFSFSEGEGVEDFDGIYDLQRELSPQRALRGNPSG